VRRGLLKKGRGLCHGISGNAYFFLALHRITNSIEPLGRANQFAAFAAAYFRELRTPDNPMSLFEGDAAYLCFCLDLNAANQKLTTNGWGHFPFLGF